MKGSTAGRLKYYSQYSTQKQLSRRTRCSCCLDACSGILHHHAARRVNSQLTRRRQEDVRRRLESLKQVCRNYGVKVCRCLEAHQLQVAVHLPAHQGDVTDMLNGFHVLRQWALRCSPSLGLRWRRRQSSDQPGGMP